MRLGAAALCAAAAALAVPAAAPAATDKRITVSSSNELVSVGGFRTGTDPTPAAAIAVFGAPTRVIKRGDTSCHYRWSALGMTITFANFGGGSACAGSLGRAQFIVVGGAAGRGWHTNRGVAIGSTSRQMRRRYRERRTGRGRYTLVRKRSFIGTSGFQEVLGANVRGGRVSSFKLTPLAAGD